MRSDWIPLLACPHTGASYELDPVRVADDEVVEAFLVSSDEREVRPIVAGIAVLPRDLGEHMRTQGSVYRRSPVNDPRLGRFLLGRAGTGYEVVDFDTVVGHYRDLAATPPEGYDTRPHPDDVALAELLARLRADGPRAGHGLVVGCGVGRPVFVLCERLAAVLGVDRSVACVRRARNVAVTREAFFLPAPKGSGMKEIPLDLAGLVRDGADFLVGDPDGLPLVSGAFDIVVVQDRDARGVWPDAAAVLREARRVTAPGGWLVRHAGHEPATPVSVGPYRAERVA